MERDADTRDRTEGGKADSVDNLDMIAVGMLGLAPDEEGEASDAADESLLAVGMLGLAPEKSDATLDHPWFGKEDLLKAETLDIRDQELHLAQQLMKGERAAELGRDAQTADEIGEALGNLAGYTSFWRSTSEMNESQSANQEVVNEPVSFLDEQSDIADKETVNEPISFLNDISSEASEIATLEVTDDGSDQCTTFDNTSD